MAVTANDFRGYLRDPPESDVELERYLAAARSEARSAGIPDYRNNAMYDMYILALAALSYESRGLSFSGGYQATAQLAAEENARKLKYSFTLALRYAGEDTP